MTHLYGTINMTSHTSRRSEGLSPVKAYQPGLCWVVLLSRCANRNLKKERTNMSNEEYETFEKKNPFKNPTAGKIDGLRSTIEILESLTSDELR